MAIFHNSVNNLWAYIEYFPLKLRKEVYLACVDKLEK
jgi:hypothetical protein